ncbi:putative gustatory receptor 59e [Drosophila kikkawai]|uniref:Gustatory receptor n=1 Tax=Drosophila kikkawai TaxID=30033 RepID=A0A6P4IPV3_DROKI|nr:putative gustatory receptor 59e [Drosophila kikkawai]
MNASDFLLNLNRVLGISPIDKKGILRWLHSLWCLGLLLYIWTNSIRRCVEFKGEIPTIEKILYLLEFPGNMSVIGFLAFHAVLHLPSLQEVELEIHRMIKRLDSKAVQMIYKKHDQRTLQLMVISIIFHGLCAVVDIITCKFEFWTTWISNSIYNLPGLMMSLGLLQYALPLHFLWLLLDEIRRALEELKWQQRPPGGITKLDARYESAFAVLVDAGGGYSVRLEEMRSTCHHLDLLHKKLLSRFGTFLILNFANSLASFCVELYLVFNFFENPQLEESVLLIYRLLWLLMHGGRIWFIMAVNEQILEKKCQLFRLINELEVCSSHLERTINRFLLQLQTSLAQPLEACGIVPLDTLALGGFFGVLMAIVIFLIQIGLGNKSLMGVALNKSNWLYI